MSRITGTIVVGSTLSPTDTLDSYPVTDPRYGIDGLRSVADSVERNAIFSQRRREGMMVYTADTKKYYQLKPSPWAFDDTDWKELFREEVIFLIEDKVNATFEIVSPIFGAFYIVSDLIYQYTGSGYILYYNTPTEEPGTQAFVKDEDTYYYHATDNTWKPNSVSIKGGPIFLKDVSVPTAAKTLAYNAIVSSALVSEPTFTVTIYYERGDFSLYNPPIEIEYNGVIQTPVGIELADKPGFEAEATFTTAATTQTITLRNGSQEYTATIVPTPIGVITAAYFDIQDTTIYPTGQIQVKNGDTTSITVTADLPFNSVTFLNTGTSVVSAQTIVVPLATSATFDVTVNQASIGPNMIPKNFEVIVSDGIYTSASYVSSNTIDTNSVVPQVTDLNLIYPIGQEALKNAEQVDIEISLDYATRIVFNSTELTPISGSLTFAYNSSLVTTSATRASGGYNVDTDNMTLTIHNDQNGSQITYTFNVKIANTAASIVPLQTPTVRTRKAGDTTIYLDDYFLFTVDQEISIMGTSAYPISYDSLEEYWQVEISEDDGFAIGVGTINLVITGLTNLAGVVTPNYNLAIDTLGFHPRELLYEFPVYGNKNIGTFITNIGNVIVQYKPDITGGDFNQAVYNAGLTNQLDEGDPTLLEFGVVFNGTDDELFMDINMLSVVDASEYDMILKIEELN